MNRPIEVFSSQEELDACLKWWQHRLYLDGWIIKVRVVDCIADADGNIQDAVGLNQLTLVKSMSYIQILSESSYTKKNFMCGHICMEQTLVHELLHCIYNWIDGNENYEGVYFVAREHQQIEQMAKSLIMAKYNLDYDYFEKQSGNNGAAVSGRNAAGEPEGSA